MEYEYGRQSQGGGTYDMGRPSMYQARQDSRDRGNPHSNNNSSSFYPRISQQQSLGGQSMSRAPPSQPPMANSGNPSGTGIKVAIKPIYRVASPAQLLVQNREVPRSLFQFDCDLERRILAEAELQGHHHVQASPPPQSSQANGGPSPNLTEQGEDPTVRKYLVMGLSKEAVIAALKTYGDLQNKVVQFCPSYTRIQEMGFASDAVAGALAMHDNDEDRAISYLV